MGQLHCAQCSRPGAKSAEYPVSAPAVREVKSDTTCAYLFPLSGIKVVQSAFAFDRGLHYFCIAFVPTQAPMSFPLQLLTFLLMEVAVIRMATLHIDILRQLGEGTCISPKVRLVLFGCHAARNHPLSEAPCGSKEDDAIICEDRAT